MDAAWTPQASAGDGPTLATQSQPSPLLSQCPDSAPRDFQGPCPTLRPPPHFLPARLSPSQPQACPTLHIFPHHQARDLQQAPTSQRACTGVQSELRCPGHPVSSPKSLSGAAPVTPPEPGNLPSSPCLTPKAPSSLSGCHPSSHIRASCPKGAFKLSSPGSGP